MLKLVIIFASGLAAGFALEFIFRTLKTRTVVIPSLYSLQMYGCTAVFLYLLYFWGIPFWLKVVLMVLFTTGIEFLTGFLLWRYKDLQLWDYSRHWGNVKGFICPQFSCYWLLIALVYYTMVSAAVHKMIIYL